MEASHRSADRRETAGRTIAQTFCLIVGGGLVAAGVLGFFFGGSGFDTGSGVEGEQFLGLEVNGWHNVVHIATGAFLLLMMPKARSAAMGALIFGALYVPVTIWGFVEGSDIANIVAINAADNWLHLGLAAAGLLVGAMGGALVESGRRERETHAGGRTGEGAVPVGTTERETARRR